MMIVFVLDDSWSSLSKGEWVCELGIDGKKRNLLDIKMSNTSQW